MSNSKKISLEGVELVYIKRKNKRIFGPFPTKKVFSLIKKEKLKKGEFVSQDKENWYEITEVKEFSSLFTDQGESELPGLKGESELPGLKGESELPGLKGESELPGIRSNLPGSKGDLPGIRSDLPGSKGDLPGIRSDLPGSKDKENSNQEINLNNLDDILDENNKSPSFDSLLKEDKIEKLDVDLDADNESLNVNSFSEEITQPIKNEVDNESLNENRVDSIEIENIDEKEEEEEELPHFISSVEKAKQKKKLSSTSKVEKNSKIKILAGVFLLLLGGLAIEWTLNIFGLFTSSTQEDKQKISKKNMKSNLSPKVVKKKKKNS
ncbi:MAG: hypothetical protein ACQES9_02105 [Myxococcota bacterium]